MPSPEPANSKIKNRAAGPSLSTRIGWALVRVITTKPVADLMRQMSAAGFGIVLGLMALASSVLYLVARYKKWF